MRDNIVQFSYDAATEVLQGLGLALSHARKLREEIDGGKRPHLVERWWQCNEMIDFIEKAIHDAGELRFPPPDAHSPMIPTTPKDAA